MYIIIDAHRCSNTCIRTYVQTCRQTDTQTGRQTDKQTDRQTSDPSMHECIHPQIHRSFHPSVLHEQVVPIMKIHWSVLPYIQTISELLVKPSLPLVAGLLPEGLLQKYFIYQQNESPWRAVRGYPKTPEGDLIPQYFYFLSTAGLLFNSGVRIEAQSSTRAPHPKPETLL